MYKLMRDIIMIDYATKFKQIVDLAIESKTMILDINNVNLSEKISQLDDFAYSIAKIIEYNEETIAFDNIASMIIDLQKEAFVDVLFDIEARMYFEGLINSINNMKKVFGA